MKELTIEEKAKAYDIALENAKHYHSEMEGDVCCVLEECFPQLKESEDEIMRKMAIKAIHAPEAQSCIKSCGINPNDVLAWLEKQDEQKSADKVEPMFNEGDWVVQENIGVYKVIEVCESWYEVLDNKDERYSIGFDKEYMCHSWTIEDAKNGDVLCDYNEGCDNPLIFILKKFEHVNFGLVTPSDYSSYCFLTANDRQSFKEGTYHHIHNIKPATKEQCDLLFQKMEEAGYVWNVNTRKLLK